jgi:hypothetical protein
VKVAEKYCGSESGGGLWFWCTASCQKARRHIGPDRALPDSAFVAPPAIAPAPTIQRLAAQTTERLAVLDRVRPILSDAIHDAKGEEAVQAVTFLGIRIMSAILKEE